MEVEVIKAKTNFDNSAAVGRKDRLRVAAYCRVSTADEEQIKSYDSMVKYYTDLIKKNPDWKFVEVYADKASTGTKAETRENFQRLIADCMAGKIDMVIAKSLSRFARNTLDTLKYVRQLRTKNVAIYFEVEKINTIKDGEFLLTILSSVAQQEVENTSAYVKKGLKMKMKRGELVGFQGCLGYKYDIETKTISVDETEAETVRYMFERYVAGAGSTMIARELNEQGIMTIRGNPWTSSSVMGVINNEKYTGDILLGKTFTVDPITKRRLDNLGEEDRFFIKNHHEPIISHETFEKAQALRERRNGGRQHHVEIGKREKYSRMFAFSSLIECGFCGGHLTRRKWHSSSKYKKTIWQCVTSTKGGKKLCPDSKGIPEQVIEEAFIESYRLLCSDNQEVMNEFLSRIEKTLGDDANEKNYQKAKKEVKQYKEKRKKLLDKYVDDGIDKETYMSMDAEYEVKYAEAQSQLEYYEKQVQGDDSLRKRIEGFRKTLTQNQVLEEFDRAVFESIVEKVIVGGYDDDGNADPYKVTFIYKTGFKDSFDHAKTKFGPKSKKSDENVSSNSSVHQENQCSNHSVDTLREHRFDVQSVQSRQGEAIGRMRDIEGRKCTMVKRGRKPADKIELSNVPYNDVCNCALFGTNEKGKYSFTDLRTLIDFSRFNVEEPDYSESDIDIIERAKRYYTSKTRFDLDYCISVRKSYSFKIMDDLYQVLWKGYNKNILNSGETIVSPNRAITTSLPKIAASHRGKKTVDWNKIEEYKANDELKSFLYNIATIGNFISVPSAEQLLLSRSYYERFDSLLKDIKEYYEKGIQQTSFNNDIIKWLDLFADNSNSNNRWKKFVDDNYLKGSFVDENYDVVDYDDTLSKFSDMIYKRSVKMIQKYEEELTKLGANS